MGGALPNDDALDGAATAGTRLAGAPIGLEIMLILTLLALGIAIVL